MIDQIKSILEVLTHMELPAYGNEIATAIELANNAIENPEADHAEALTSLKLFLDGHPELMVCFASTNQSLSDLEGIKTLNESEEEGEEENPDGEEDGGMDAEGMGSDDNPEEDSVEDSAEEEAGIEEEEEQEPERDDFKINELEDRLRQIDINVNKIKELETNEQLESLYLEELGKKYLIEQELYALGKKDHEDTVESSVASIFESKADNGKIRISLMESKRAFNKKFGKTNVNTSKLFESIISDKIVSELSSDNIVVLDGDIELSRPEGVDVIFVTNNGDVSDDAISATSEDGVTFVVEAEIPNLINSIDEALASDQKEFYVFATEDGLYVSQYGEYGELGLTPDMDDFIFTEEDYSKAISMIEDISSTLGFEVVARKAISSPHGIAVMDSVTDNHSTFSLNESHIVGGITLKKGSPCKHIPSRTLSKMYESISETGETVKFSADSTFEDKLTPISEDEHSILELSTGMDGVDFFGDYDKALRLGITFQMSEAVKGSSLYNDITATLGENSCTMSVFIKDLTPSELEYYMTNPSNLGVEDMNTLYNMSDDVRNFMTSMSVGDLSHENIGSEDLPSIGQDDLYREIETGQKLRVIKDVYINSDGDVTEDHAGGENTLLFESNSVVVYDSDHGISGFGNEENEWVLIPSSFVEVLEEFDVDSLEIGNRYTLRDAVNEVSATYEGCTEVDGEEYFEFTTPLNESYTLTRKEVRFNTKK